MINGFMWWGDSPQFHIQTKSVLVWILVVCRIDNQIEMGCVLPMFVHIPVFILVLTNWLKTNLPYIYMQKDQRCQYA